MNLKGWMSRAVIYQRHFVHYECQVYAKDINLSGLYMFVDISINIGLVIITCMWRSYSNLRSGGSFFVRLFLACESIRRVKLETWAEKTECSRRLDFFTSAKNQKKKSNKKKSLMAGYCYRKTRRNFSCTISQDTLISFMCIVIIIFLLFFKMCYPKIYFVRLILILWLSTFSGWNSTTR